MKLYPLLMRPFFRSGEATPWGGDMLRDAFLKDTDADQTGESLETSALSGAESRVENGEYAGRTLSEMTDLLGESLTGACGAFPLLLKLVDAASDMPAACKDASSAWIILNADPDSAMICGTENGAPRTVPARPGDVFYIPAGMLHGLGGGIQAYSLQTPCAGDIAPAAGPEPELIHPEGATILCKGGSRTYYASDVNFELCRLNVSGDMPLPQGRMLLITPAAPCVLRWEDGEIALDPFRTAVIPAAMEGVSLCGVLKAFMACLPDGQALRSELTYRAERVAGLMDNI